MNRTLLGLIVVAMVIVACAPGPAGPTGAAPTGPALTLPGETAAPATPAAETAAPSTPPVETTTPSAAAIDIETVLPETLGGQPLETTVVTGSALKGLFFGGMPAIERSLGVDATSMNAVVGHAGGTEIVTVVQVPGKDEATIEEATKFGVGLMGQTAGIEGDAATVGGKAVKGWTGTFGNQQVTTYIYVVGDTFFVIAGTVTPAVAEELLASLP